ncbi:four helix bundle protein [Candidatus Parcubacteria bacterium]|nr:four helix bundle protein [Candidatus Parcubacteria bacterium]
MHSYRNLIVWQRAIQLVVAIYELTEQFPREEIYGLIAQMRRSAVTIASNIAEGRHRGTKQDFLQFLRIAYSSGAELETQLEIAQRLPKTKRLDYARTTALLTEVMKMLHAMIKTLNPRATKS